MKKLNLENCASWLVILPLIAVNLVYFVFFFLPGKKEIEAMRTEIVDTQMYLATAASRLAQIERIRGQLKESEAHVVAWRQDAPQADNAARLFGEINHRVESAGVAVTRFEPRGVDEMDHLDRMALQLKTEGSFAQMFGLVQQLEQLPETIWLESIHLRAHRAPSQALKSALLATPTASVQSEINLAIFAAKPKDSN